MYFVFITWKLTIDVGVIQETCQVYQPHYGSGEVYFTVGMFHCEHSRYSESNNFEHVVSKLRYKNNRISSCSYVNIDK